MSWLFSAAMMKACESSHYSLVPAEEYSADISSAGEQFAQLNVMPTPLKFWRNDKTMEFSSLSRFGLTLRLLTEDHGAELLMSFLVAFHAKTSAQQGKELELMESAPASGQRWRGSFATYSQDLSSWKTAQHSLFADSEPSLETWPRSGSMRNGECYQRLELEPIIPGPASGLLPTPSGCQSGQNHVSGRLDEWGGSSNIWRGTEIGKTSSPAFEEWVMGWPVQWTGLMPYETAKFHEWQQQHSLCLQNEQVGKEAA